MPNWEILLHFETDILWILLELWFDIIIGLQQLQMAGFWGDDYEVWIEWGMLCVKKDGELEYESGGRKTSSKTLKQYYTILLVTRPYRVCCSENTVGVSLDLRFVA